MAEWFPIEVNTLLIDTVLIFTAGLLFAVLARRLRQSPLIGYLLAGILIGPNGLGLVQRAADVPFFADVGVVLLMFALGVQLSLRNLLEVRLAAIGGGLLQITLSIVLGVIVGWLFGLPPFVSLILGYAVALSSSVVLVRLLGEASEFHTKFARAALGISIMQDLMAVVLISTVPFLAQAGGPDSYLLLWIDLIKALLLVVWVIVLARWVAPIILNWASASGSREIFLPTVVVLSLGGAILSGFIGFSYALGAFLSGIVISESLYSQAVLAEVIPLRDLFGLLFFVSLGMLFDPAVVLGLGALALVLLIAAVVGKSLIIFGVLVALRYHPYTALIAGVSLSQVGEFSFVISREALVQGVISPAIHATVLALAIVSIALTPILLPAVRWGYSRLQQRGVGMGWRAEEADELPAPLTLDGTTSVLLCGFGRVGRTLVQALDTFRVPFLVVDIDRGAVQSLRRRGIRAVYGDAANPRLLERIDAGHFTLGVIVASERQAVRLIANNLRRLNPAMRLLLRSHTDQETAQFLAMGVDGVVHVELEASLAFVHEVLTTAKVDAEIVAAFLDDIRIGYYEGLLPRPRD
jgi:CPA2 family monovalent cation:H+ antiporter-2